MTSRKIADKLKASIKAVENSIYRKIANKIRVAISTIPDAELNSENGSGTIFPGLFGNYSEWRKRKKISDDDVKAKQMQQEEFDVRSKTDNKNETDPTIGDGKSTKGVFGRDSEWRTKKRNLSEALKKFLENK